MTRSTDLSKVFFYVGQAVGAKEVDEEDVFERYLELKVRSYKSQDLKAGRPLVEIYATKQWLLTRTARHAASSLPKERFKETSRRIAQTAESPTT